MLVVLSTQAVTATPLGSAGGRHFTLTATDSQWNQLTDDVGSSSLGEVMAGKRITAVVGDYNAGNAAWRIKSRGPSGQVKRAGFLHLATEADVAEATRDFGAPLVVAPDDELEVYPEVVP